MTTLPSVDSCRRRLHLAGWSIGDAGLAGPVWLVCGSRGEHLLHAEGRTQAEAWYRARQLAEAVELLAPIRENLHDATAGR
jgi:hypothetical protein